MEILYDRLIEVFGTLFLLGVFSGVGLLVKYIRSKTTNEAIVSYMDILSGLVSDTVAAAMQATVLDLKKNKQFDSAAAGRVKNAVASAVKAKLPNDAEAILEKAGVDVQRFISEAIEAEVLTQKQAYQLKTLSEPSVNEE